MLALIASGTVRASLGILVLASSTVSASPYITLAYKDNSCTARDGKKEYKMTKMEGISCYVVESVVAMWPGISNGSAAFTCISGGMTQWRFYRTSDCTGPMDEATRYAAPWIWPPDYWEGECVTVTWEGVEHHRRLDKAVDCGDEPCGADVLPCRTTIAPPVTSAAALSGVLTHPGLIVLITAQRFLSI